MRASAIVENCGIPTVSLVCDGFSGQARATAGGLGAGDLPIARLVGAVDTQSLDELRYNIASVTAVQVVEALTSGKRATMGAADYAATDIVAKGTFDEIDALFEERRWSDGLPIVPPTPERVAAFFAFSTDAPDRVIGVMKSSGRAATVQNVAVNAVMAGCAPAYMPLLVAITEVLADPDYGVEHSGDTTSGEAQIILSGPVVEKLRFNTEEGALRDGQRANTSVGRFLRLMLRNVAGFLPGDADKATFGHTFRVVLAENASAIDDLGWSGFNQDRGFEATDSIVALTRCTGDTIIGSIYGSDPESILRYLADGLIRQSSWDVIFAAGFAPGTSRPLLVLSPQVARTLAKAGLSKADVRNGLFKHARIPAHRFEAFAGEWSNLVPGRQTLNQLAEAGKAASVFAESDDRERLVPIVERAEHIILVVSGDPRRSNAMAHGSNGMHGMLTSRKIRMP